ncbi:MAG: DNA-deoxyinosine glycosylase [Sulfuricurvum sp.]|uniref:DNA-deoxyinosine glycosylase n=1 Tax=Sulfuricurvum sp. TaxID=2025608 RepID=UPI00262DB33A|nr:DNA-deoxyinosine glycosylase [Sulfuricurvum sp.]MDD2828882.1 DNA-deoxyinosine glycosylase [Sulfuricurvum sp.]MDD4948545.1 DNA-deoxyinosine glycosylase [Sulfuricurvum sp.]
MNSYNHPFPPLLDQNTRILFLGSFPSIASFEQAFYYAHPRNAFWPILEEIFDVHLETNEAKKTFCLEKGIGLWDVIGSCERSNSSDTNLKNCIPNDFEKLLEEYPNIQVLAFTGKKSHDLFMKFFKNLKIEKVLLPSTSPAHAAMKKEEKAKLYKDFLGKYLAI